MIAATPAVAMAHVPGSAVYWFLGAHLSALVLAVALAVCVPSPRTVRLVALSAAVAMAVGPFVVRKWAPFGIVYLVLLSGLGLRESVFTMVVATLVPPVLAVALVLWAGRTLVRMTSGS